MQIPLALSSKFTALDIIGPFQALADVPGQKWSSWPARPDRWSTTLAKAALDLPTSAAAPGTD